MEASCWIRCSCSTCAKASGSSSCSLAQCQHCCLRCRLVMLLNLAAGLCHHWIHLDSGPTRPLHKSAPGQGSSGSGHAPVINLASGLKSVHPNGSRFAAVVPHSNLSTMSWHIPLANEQWNVLVGKETKSFASPYPNVRSYSDSHPIWYSPWAMPE